ncbi:MAG: hypothetical protein AAGE65_08855 [Planctomycetota bacterium]
MAEGFVHFVLESPWPLAVVLGIAAAAVQVVVLRGGKKKQLAVPPVLLLAAIGVLAAGYAVETANEAVDRHTRALVAATAPLDRSVIDASLADDVRLLDPTGAVWMSGRSLRDRLASIAGARELDQRVVSVDVQPPASGGVSARMERVAVLELRTRDASGVPILSSWALHWRENGEAWELFDVQWLSLGGQTPDRSLIP